MPESPITETMREFAEMARQFAQQFANVELDYSESSLEQVEQILGRLHDDMPRGLFAKLLKRGPSRESVNQICAIFGAYVGETIRRRWGGRMAGESSIATWFPRTLRHGTHHRAVIESL